MSTETLVVSQTASGRLWFLHPERSRFDWRQAVRVNDVPDRAEATSILHAMEREERRRSQTAQRHPLTWIAEAVGRELR